MKIWDWLKRKKTDEEVLVPEETEFDMDHAFDRGNVNIHDAQERSKYIEGCLSQIAEASDGIDQLEDEYQRVNGYLQDIEEVEMLDGSDKERLIGHAKQVNYLSRDSARYDVPKNRLKDADYRKMRRFEEDVEESIEKLKEAERYQELIRQDLRKLEGEKHAFLYRQEEALTGLNNYRGMAVIVVCAIFICIGVLMFMQFGMELDTSIGYVLVMLSGGLTLVIIYFRYIELQNERKSVSSGINKLIQLQNRVKIRYVNNTNLLDYLYLKYEVPSADSLQKLWDQYQEEKEERFQMEQLQSSLEHHKDEMVKLLRRYQLQDPEIWTRQTEAILDSREMVEVRHQLIARRQKLRKQMDYNRELAKAAQDEVKKLVKSYPEYSQEIMDLVDSYEEKSR